MILQDDGMSIIELVIASVIGLLVLSVAYLIFETAMKGFSQVENQTLSGRTAAQSLQGMERPIREATAITTANSYDIAFLSDVNDDNSLEAVRFWIDAGSKRLMMQRANADHTASSTPAVVADNIQNRTLAVPLFAYFRDVGAPVKSLAAGETTGSVAKIVRLEIVTQPPVTSASAPPSYRVQTEIFLRNKSQ
ncbi:MAG TPA: hypothetical protein VGK50_02260 [Coriobacteriia bacterium]|jgi:cytoskeletal protein RodZ